MKIVEISASLGNDLKRYNTLTKVSTQPFTEQVTVLYGVTKGTDIIQTNAPTNILVDYDDNPIDDSEPVYFGIRVYPFISARQNISCNNNIISYGEVFGLSDVDYFYTEIPGLAYDNMTVVPDPYPGKLYPQPEFDDTLPIAQLWIANYQQAMQQFINDCVFPTKPNLDIPGQSQSANFYHEGISYAIIPYFNNKIVVLSKLNQRNPTGVLSLIQDKKTDDTDEFEKYMVQFDGQNLNFKFGMAVNSDFTSFFTEPPEICLPYLYRTYGALIRRKGGNNVPMGVIMQCLLYDSNGKVISA